MAGINEVKVGGAGNTQQPRQFTPKPFSAPTSGLEHVVFDCTKSGKKKASDFSNNCELLAEYLVTSGTLKRGGPVAVKAVKDAKAPSFVKPGSKPDDKDPFGVLEWEDSARQYLEDNRYWKNNNTVIFSLFLSHSTQAMRVKLKSMQEWEVAYDGQDGIALMQMIRAAVFGTDGTTQSMLEIVQAWKKYMLTWQRENTSLDQYVKDADAAWETLDSLIGPPGLCKKTVEVVLPDGLNFDSMQSDDHTEFSTKAVEAFKAAMFFDGLNTSKFSAMKANVANAWSGQRKDLSPSNMANALRMANEYVVPVLARPVGKSPGVAFIQQGEPAQDKPAPTNPGATVGTGAGKGKHGCYHCGEDHLMIHCPKLTAEQIKKLYAERKQRIADEATSTTGTTGVTKPRSILRSTPPAAYQEGQVHLGISEGDVDAIDTHQDDYDDDFAFLQKASSNLKVVEARKTLKEHFVYLDSTSSFNQVFKEEHLDEVKKVSTSLRAHCNAGTSHADEKGLLLGVFECWLVRNGIANILSVPQLERDGFEVEYVKRKWSIVCPNGTVLSLKRDSGLCEGFPYLDMRDLKSDGVAMAQMVETVRGNVEGFTKRELAKANLARKAQAVLASPSETEFMKMVSNNTGVKNIPIVPSDLTRARIIFGPDRPNVAGKTVRKKPARVDTDTLGIPDDFHRLHRFITLVGDVMFVNGVAFLITLSRRIRLFTAEHVPSRTAKQLGSSLMKVVKGLYARNGYVVQTILMDLEFEKVRDECPLVEINLAGAREHVGESERGNQTIQERVRALTSTLPSTITTLPKQFVIHMVYFAVLMINAFPAAQGVSERYSPREIVTGRGLVFGTSIPNILFGTYVEASIDAVITNTNQLRTYAGIYLGPVGNIQGTHKVFDLKTGVVKKTRTVTEFPMPDNVILLVNAWGKRYQKNLRSSLVTFLDRRKQPYDWENDDLSGVDNITEVIRADEYPCNFPGIQLERESDIDDAAAIEVVLPPSTEEDTENAARNAGVVVRASTANPGVSFAVDDDVADANANVGSQECSRKLEIFPKVEEVEEGDDDDDTIPELVNDDNDDDDEDEDLILPEGTSRKRQKPVYYKANFTNKVYDKVTEGVINFNMDEDHLRPFTNDDVILHVLGVIMVQNYSIKKGLKHFGVRGEQAVTKELQQHHDMETYFPVDPDTLTQKQRKEALNSLMFLMEKRDKSVKARSCADGSKMRLRPHYRKEDNSSPTCANESTMLITSINAHEGRDTMSIDLPGAFLHAFSDEEILMMLKGPLCELMVQIAPKVYQPYVRYDSKGVAFMYVRMNKAMYGLLKSALLFYKKLVADLKQIGFSLNPYDPCVANRDVNGSQQTVIFHVDDLHCSHVDPTVNTELALYLSDKYGDGISVKRGKVHDFLGVDYDYSEKGSVKVSQIRYLSSILADFPEKLGEPAATPAADHLFKVRDPADARLLDEARATTFHHTTAQLLFASSRARRDIQTVVSFLTTRVKHPDEDDWAKLKRCLKYLKGTLHMKLTLTVDNLNVIHWWIDASDRTHMDCKGHTGAMMSLGQGATMSYSSKQKINTKSSTESELVGADQVMTRVIWSLYFVEAQGYTIDHNIVFQDNQSTMRLEMNGALSSSSRTKHIHARYYFITDRIEMGEVEVVYCPTEQMWADVLNKPKQGRPFRLDRSHLMNVPLDYNDEYERKRTHPELLPQDEPCNPVQPAQQFGERLYRRSVLGDIQNRQTDGSANPSWSQRVRRNMEKLR